MSSAERWRHDPGRTVISSETGSKIGDRFTAVQTNYYTCNILPQETNAKLVRGDLRYVLTGCRREVKETGIVCNIFKACIRVHKDNLKAHPFFILFFHIATIRQALNP
jgi:hypothetical protein